MYAEESDPGSEPSEADSIDRRDWDDYGFTDHLSDANHDDDSDGSSGSNDVFKEMLDSLRDSDWVRIQDLSSKLPIPREVEMPEYSVQEAVEVSKCVTVK